MQASRRRVRERLRARDGEVDGPRSIVLRTQAVPAAYRTFARQVGLDPDADGDPLAALLQARLLRGTFPSAGPVPDACALALVETGVPVWGADHRLLPGGLRIGIAPDLGLQVECGAERVAPLLGPVAEELAATKETTEARLFAIVVGGVPRGTVQEALWVAERALQG